MLQPISRGAAAVCALVFSLACQGARAAPVISEVFYDASGSDAGVTFLELFGSPGTSLAGLVVEGVNGGDGSVYKTLTLSGVIPADGVFLIGDDAGGGVTSVPGADLVADIDFQNGPDSVVLRGGGGGILDAVGYGSFGGGSVFAGEGGAAPDAAAGSSIARFDPLLDTNDNSVDFGVLASPTPGSVPVSAVPLPAAAWLFLSGLSGMVVAGRRRGRMT